MPPVVRAALACALLSGLSALGERGASLAGARVERAAGTAAGRDWAVCPPSTLPDGETCVPLPYGDEGGEELAAAAGAHRDRRGRWRTYDAIPRRPDRPADHAAYRLPVPPPPAGPLVGSGFDLDLPDEAQRRGRRLSHVGHGGLDLPRPRGTEVRVVALEHQQGDAEVLHVGRLFGTSVVLLQAVREGGRLRDYVVLFGHLDAPAPGIARGQTLPDGALAGFVGDSASEGMVHLHLEVRRVRDGVDARALGPERVVLGEVSVACDPRNVLPRR